MRYTNVLLCSTLNYAKTYETSIVEKKKKKNKQITLSNRI